MQTVQGERLPGLASPSSNGNFPRSYVDSGLGRVAYRTSGVRPTVVALHGLGGSAMYWQSFAMKLPNGIGLVAPDLLGFGSSAKPHLEYTPEVELESVEAAIEAANVPERFALIGHSLGGLLAVEYAARHPDRVAKLGLVTTPAFLAPWVVSGKRVQGEDQWLRWANRIHLGRRMARPVVALWVRTVGDYGPYPAELIVDTRQYTMSAYRSVARHCLGGHDYRPALLAIADIPTYLLFGDHDRRAKPRDARQIASYLHHPHLHIASGRHQVILTNDIAARQMASWLTTGI